MPWEILIIPLIAFGAWILSTIFKENEVDKSKAPRRLDGARPPRRPASALDSFLDESRRRRDVPPEMQTRSEPPKPAPPPAPVQRRPAPAPPPAPGPRPTPQRRNVPVLATIIDEPPSRPEVRKPAVVEKAPPPAPPLPPTPPAPAAPPPAPPAPVAKREQPVSGALREVVRLLRSPRSAAAAILMREILDRPPWMRRR